MSDVGLWVCDAHGKRFCRTCIEAATDAAVAERRALRADAMQDIQWSRGFDAGWNAALGSDAEATKGREARERRTTDALRVLRETR